MNNAKLYVIDYTLHGTPKSFIIRSDKMDNAEAWHWASCDAGVGRIPRFGRAELSVDANAAGDAGAFLAMLRQSPLLTRLKPKLPR